MASDRYGTLGTPDERTHIEVVEDPVRIVRSAYAAWLGLTRQSCLHDMEGLPTLSDYPPEISAGLHEEAVRLLAPSAKAFKAVTREEQDAILATVTPESSDASGLFLSALLNATELPVLDGTFRHKALGYRLAPGKTLIVRHSSVINDLGPYAQGAIINYGQVRYGMAREALGGLQVNRGIVYQGQANKASGGLHINSGECNDSFAWWNAGGVHLNYGYAEAFANDACGGVHINHGTSKSWMARDAEGGVQANHGQTADIASFVKGGVQVNPGRADRDFCRKYDDGKYARAMTLLYHIDRKLDPVRAFADLKPEDAYVHVQAHDWSRLEREVLAVGKEIEHVLE